MANYGASSVVNFATSSGYNPTFVTRGWDRPILRARQLIYGDFTHGRWYIVELGLAYFNITGFTAEYYRYWSGRVALHESLAGPWANPYFELGATVRSLTQFTQPSNTGLIYPPSVDILGGLERDFWKIHAGADIGLEQALTETSVAGSYASNSNKPSGASTRLTAGVELGYRFTDGQALFLRGSERVFRWPDDDNAALWAHFDEGSLGRSVELQWRGEW